MSKPRSIYVLQNYANRENLVESRGQVEHTLSISYNSQGIKIELSETNSLIEEEYNLSLKSAKYHVESTESKEAMIHNHKKGHTEKHLQFKLQAKRETIRIFLEGLDAEDYTRCIKGFLHISCDIIKQEQKKLGIEENLTEFFFNSEIKSLVSDRQFLMSKINRAFQAGQIKDSSEKGLDAKGLIELKRQAHLKPFLEF